MIIALHVLLTRTDFGRSIRATSENREAAALMGIDVKVGEPIGSFEQTFSHFKLTLQVFTVSTSTERKREMGFSP
jgi:adenine-specific DNA glycosylase